MRQTVRPDGQHEQQTIAFEVPGQECDEVPGPAIDPVQVLEDQQGRRRPRRGRRAVPGRVRTGSPGRGPSARRTAASRPAVPADTTGPIPGRSRPISSRAGPRTDAMRSGGRSRRNVRNASVSGAYGRPSSARSRQPPTRTSRAVVLATRRRTPRSAVSCRCPPRRRPRRSPAHPRPRAPAPLAVPRAPTPRPTSSGLETSVTIARVYARTVRLRYDG